jgi:hypothetical protein
MRLQTRLYIPWRENTNEMVKRMAESSTILLKPIAEERYNRLLLP